MIRKEIGDLVRSWRFIVLLLLIVLTFLASMYVSLSNLRSAASNALDPDRVLLYLKILTTTDGTLPSFHIFMSFLGAILGIGLGFDAVNVEQSSGTLIRLLAQPVYRDNFLLAKFISPLKVITALFLSLGLLMIGAGMLITGVPIEGGEFLRILTFILLTVLYVAFWLSLSILFSVKFKQATTSALSAIAIWLFFTIFYRIIVNLVVKACLPDPAFLSPAEIVDNNNLILNILRFSPSQLYTDATTVLLMPSLRSLGPLTMEQMAGAIPSPLSYRESLLIVWPQLTGLLGGTVACFALSYYLFMKEERSEHKAGYIYFERTRCCCTALDKNAPRKMLLHNYTIPWSDSHLRREWIPMVWRKSMSDFGSVRQFVVDKPAVEEVDFTNPEELGRRATLPGI